MSPAPPPCVTEAITRHVGNARCLSLNLAPRLNIKEATFSIVTYRPADMCRLSPSPAPPPCITEAITRHVGNARCLSLNLAPRLNVKEATFSIVTYRPADMCRLSPSPAPPPCVTEVITCYKDNARCLSPNLAPRLNVKEATFSIVTYRPADMCCLSPSPAPPPCVTEAITRHVGNARCLSSNLAPPLNLKATRFVLFSLCMFSR